MAWLLCFILQCVAGVTAAHAQSEIRMRTSAAIGEQLRIQLNYTSDATISGGVKKGVYYGEYEVVDPTQDIIISGKKLEELECYGCKLTALDVTKATELQILRCYNNSIATLDLAHCAELNTLDCHANQLTTLDVSANSKLWQLNCAGNKLTALTFGQANSELTKVDCGSNSLTAVDLAQLPALTDFYAGCNQLATVDFSHNPKLNWVKVYSNKITDGMTDLIASLPDNENASQGIIYIVDTRDENEGNACYMKHMAAAGQRNWITCDWAGGIDTGSMTGTFYYGLDYTPDYGNRTITLTTTREAGQTITLDISAGGRDLDLEGVAEKAPYSGKQTFTLTGQTVVIRGDVTKLTCSGNDLTALTFAGDKPLLTDLDCSCNQIETLALDSIESLQNLKCQQNRLTALTVAGCTSLQRIDCYRNCIRGLYMSIFVKSLPSLTNSPYLFIIDSQAPADTPEGNECTTDDASVAKGKGWSVKDYVNGGYWGFGKSFDGSDDQLPEQYVEFTRQETGSVSFNVEMCNPAEVPVLKGAEIVSWNGQGLIIKLTSPTARIYGDIKKLTAIYSFLTALDVSHLPNLTELNCGLNYIKELNLAQNSKLELLSCEINELTALDLSSTSLDYLNCYGNSIQGAHMTALVNSLPSRTATSAGMFIVVDNTFTGNDGQLQEHNVCTTSDVAAAKARNWTAYDLNGDPSTMKPYAGSTPTGIHAAGAQGSAGQDALYTLGGQRVSTPAGHGIYIRNGRKVLR
ncbi:MAG TPA: hypothetical protein DC006_06095 [Prevotellaceae bacterium]|nr:hypothetical protein [Prevotellaceae bacterium]HBE54776.1 hypothetical protein [Prevotellaceae bacterium]